MENLKHIAIISGGLGDIGRAIATEFADRGVDVAIGDLKEPAEAADFLKKLGNRRVRARYDQVDVSQSEAVKKWVAFVEQSLGIPDIIIPCAAQITFEDARSITTEQWDKEILTNLGGQFYLAQAGANRLVETHKTGSIVFIGSFAGLIPEPMHVAYSVGKSGTHALTKVMALEYGPIGIRVNAVAPGAVNAGVNKIYYDQHPGSDEKDKQIIPLRKLVEPNEVAWHIANLCDSRSGNITGVIFPIDGGMSVLPDMRVSRGEELK